MGQEDVPIAFFSYCREDSEFALKLAADLKGAGAHVWIDQLDIEPGTPWDRAVEAALTNSPRMLVVLSPVSVNSDNVRDEVSFALGRQKRVIPVLYRDCDVPFRLARLQHIDFRPDYERALTILLRALGVGHAPQAQASAVAVAAVAEIAVSPAETDNARQQKVEEERRLSEDQAQLEQARKYAGEQKRLKQEREEAAKQEAREAERQQPETADPAVQEQSRREQRAAEQARLEEEARLAAERVRQAQQEKERREAEIKARQEQLRREEQESVERKSFNLDSQPPSQQREPEPPPPVALASATKRPHIEPRSTPVAAAKGLSPRQPESKGLNLASPKYLIIGAAVVVALALVIFLLAHRSGPQNLAESKVAESNKPAETAAIQQPQNQAPAAANPTEPAPSAALPPAAAPTNAPNQDAAKAKASPVATDKELAKASNLAVGAPPSAANAVNASKTDSTSNRVRLSQGVSHGMLMYEIAPKYPPLARSAHVQGEVALAVIIGKDGSVADIKAESGHPLLIPAAIDAVKHWRYKPYKLNGKPVEVDTRVIVNFTLTNQ